MRTRDPEKKRRLLLEAALEEFAEYGVAGARVDRIAKRAGVSAGLVYYFFDGKESLFEAVFDLVVEQVVASVPMDADDLGEYAGRLFDATQSHPQVTRFLAWYQLERGATAGRRASIAAATKDKAGAIADAQRRGVVSDRFDSGQVLALVLSLANMWQHQNADLTDLVPEEARRATIVEAVRRLVAP